MSKVLWGELSVLLWFVSPQNAQKANCAEETGASSGSSSRHSQMSGRPDVASAPTAATSVYVPRGSRQGLSAASSDFWDSPDYNAQKAGSWSAYTLGDIRKVEKAIESGGMSLQEYMQQHQQAKEHKNEESQKSEEEKEDKGTKDAAGHIVRGERKREVWREKGAPDIKDKVKSSGGVGLGGVALQDDVEEEFSFFDDHAVGDAVSICAARTYTCRGAAGVCAHEYVSVAAWLPARTPACVVSICRSPMHMLLAYPYESLGR